MSGGHWLCYSLSKIHWYRTKLRASLQRFLRGKPLPGLTYTRQEDKIQKKNLIIIVDSTGFKIIKIL